MPSAFQSFFFGAVFPLHPLHETAVTAASSTTDRFSFLYGFYNLCKSDKIQYAAISATITIFAIITFTLSFFYTGSRTQASASGFRLKVLINLMRLQNVLNKLSDFYTDLV